MKKTFLIILSLLVLLSSVLTVAASAENAEFPDDMYDDDANVTYNDGTTATTKGSLLGNIGGDGIGDFVGGVVESVFQDEDVSEQVNDKAEGILGGFGDLFEGIKDFIPSTNKQTTGSNFFDPINPIVSSGGYTPNAGTGNLSSTNASLNGEAVDFNTTVNPYAKPTVALNPGDKGDGVKWLQWVLIYTECGLQNSITGDYDDATTAAVKQLQLNCGMNPDGIASLEVIEKAEQTYNDYINGIVQQGTNAPAVFNTVGNAQNQNNKQEKSLDIKITIIIVVLVVVWIFAIAIVCIIVHIKRKNITLSEDGQIIKPEKKSKRRRELQDSKPLTQSKTLLSLTDEAVEDSTEGSTEFDTDVSNITLKTEFIEVTSEEEAEESTEISEDSEDTTEESQDEVQEAVEETVTEEQVTEPAQKEQEEVSETEKEEQTEETNEASDDAESADSFLETEEDTAIDVVDVQDTFNQFAAFNDDYDDDGEIKISSLLEMKQRKAKAQAKEETKNS